MDLNRKSGKKALKLKGIAKLDDANHAGGNKSEECTLILTEGDSAKSLAMSGLSVIGRDFYGVFPLKGKPLNARDAQGESRINLKIIHHTTPLNSRQFAVSQVSSNLELKNIISIMGLKFGTEYTPETVKTLRYGHLMIMADQDFDGSHIKGLVINFIHKVSERSERSLRSLTLMKTSILRAYSR